MGASGTVYCLDGSETSLTKLNRRARHQGWEPLPSSAGADADTGSASSSASNGKVFGHLAHPDFGDLVLIHGDVCTATPWRLGSCGDGTGRAAVDKVWCRWLLTWVQPADVGTVLLHASRATKPGGMLMVWDYFNSAVFDVRSSFAEGAPCWRLVKASDSHLDLGRASYVLYGVKYIDLVSLEL